MTWRILCAVVTIAVAASFAEAQCTATGIPSSCTQARTMQITVRRTVRITITPSTTVLASPSATDYDAGFSQSAGHTVAILANTGWQLSVRSNQGTWASGRGGRGNKPRADLLWSASAGGPFVAMTNTATTVATGGATTTATVVLHYRVVWSWTLDTPATYSLPILLRIAAP